MGVPGSLILIPTVVCRAPTRPMGEAKTNPHSQSAGRDSRRPDRCQGWPGSAAVAGRLNPLSGVSLFGGPLLPARRSFDAVSFLFIPRVVFSDGFVFWVPPTLGLELGSKSPNMPKFAKKKKKKKGTRRKGAQFSLFFSPTWALGRF